ncbi:Cupin-like domain-containing protein [Methylomagnum ishizawai]|uniref:Cupin-like domain-containing protein n=1 Tax=Methylomagnum ishizawai TaxID=1760988 RepID=A0A1Y6DBT9_9GAMM|nr:cupin-like domain-containing protein [Methylomagnum ishizawai]SMF97564.1 Cupin-like domain-containing protein [Methylomagnum ishizawai]
MIVAGNLSAAPTLTAPDRRHFADVERRERLSPEAFFAEYVAEGRPVLVPGALRECRALSRWNLPYLRDSAGQRRVRLKRGLTEGGFGGMTMESTSLADYIDHLQSHEAALRRGAVPPPQQRPAYLHDMPLLSLLPEAADDLAGFPADYFPPWYRNHWCEFAQFFLGPSHSLTPLHFDCLLTHNLFFQVAGRKRFILLPREQWAWCYRRDWRWCEVDPEAPDELRHPLYRQARPLACVVEPGDLLYMPPGMLHHVRGLECSISFNVDWHTPDSALKGVLAGFQGMPRKNVYYNAVIALGLWTGIPAPKLLPWYRSYLNYVS